MGGMVGGLELEKFGGRVGGIFVKREKVRKVREKRVNVNNRWKGRVLGGGGGR